MDMLPTPFPTVGMIVHHADEPSVLVWLVAGAVIALIGVVIGVLVMRAARR